MRSAAFRLLRLLAGVGLATHVSACAARGDASPRSQAEPFSEGLLFEVTAPVVGGMAPAAPSYVFGTIHLGGPRLPVPEPVRRRVQAADTFCMEILPDPAEMMGLLQKMLISDGRTLPQIVGPELWTDLEPILAASDLGMLGPGIVQRLAERGGGCLGHPAAGAADHEGRVVALARMRTGDEGVQPLDPVGEALFQQEIQRAIGDGRVGAPPLGLQPLQHLVGAEGRVLLEQDLEHAAADRREAAAAAGGQTLGQGSGTGPVFASVAVPDGTAEQQPENGNHHDQFDHAETAA